MIRHTLLRCAVGLSLAVGSNAALATSNACWLDADVVKLRHSVVVPVGTSEAFIVYLQSQVPNEHLLLGGVESDDNVIVILQNVDDGILAIDISNRKGSRVFDIEVKGCDFKPRWTPYWRYVQVAIQRFMDDPANARAPRWSPNKSLQRAGGDKVNAPYRLPDFPQGDPALEVRRAAAELNR